MSISQDCCYDLQNSEGSLYNGSELGKSCRRKSGNWIISTTCSTSPHKENYNSTEIIGIICKPNYVENSENDDLPIIAHSQPPAPSILSECQQVVGSLFSVVSAPLLPLDELNAKENRAINASFQENTDMELKIGENASNLLDDTCSFTSSQDNVTFASILCKRPETLSIPTPYSPLSRILHANKMDNQIAEIDEDDNENLLTVSSITSRPLIAKSHELRSDRNLRCKKHTNSFANVITKTTSKVDNINNTESRKLSHSPLNTVLSNNRYGWLIVFGAFCVQFWVAGLVKSYGVLYVEVMETFPSSTATVASWIPAVLSALCLALAPVSSALCQRFSCRTVVFIGGLFCALGMILSYFATNLLHLLFTFGILTGIGGGLSTTPGIIIVSTYFEKHRALANGICVSGTAIGSFILPVLIKHLAEKFGFHITILILGFCMLDVCVSALLYRPIEENRNYDEEKRIMEDEVDKSLDGVHHNINILTGSTYLYSCDDALNSNFIEHLFLEESKNLMNDYHKIGNSTTNKSLASCIAENDYIDEVTDMIGETTFIKPIKKVRSSGIIHSVEDLSTNSTWVYRKNSGTDSNRVSRRGNAFANDEIISKIKAHLETSVNSESKPPIITRGHSRSMEIPADNQSKYRNDLAQLKKKRKMITNRISSVETDDDDDEIKKFNFQDRVAKYLDISLLKNPTFILMCLSVTLMSVGCPYMLYYLPAHLVSIGYTKSKAGYLVTVSAVFDLVGRLGLGWFSDLQLFDRRKIYVICIVGAGIAVLPIPSENSIYMVGLSAAIYGFCLGSWYVLMPVLLADIFGTDRISSSYGLVRMFQSIGAISVPPFAGFLRDLSGSYTIVFYCMGTCMVFGCLPLLLWAILESRERKIYIKRKINNDTSSIT